MVAEWDVGWGSGVGGVGRVEIFALDLRASQLSAAGSIAEQ